MAYKRISPQPVVEGGTGAQTLTNHAVLIGQATSAIVGVGPVASTGCVLQSNGAASDPGFSTATYPITTTINQLLYSSAANTIVGLSTANNGTLVTSAAGVPSILAGPGTTGNILQSNAAAAPSFSTATYPSTTTINQILYSSANNTVSQITAVNQAVLTTSTTGVPSLTSIATNGQIIIGSTAGNPAAATISAGAGISVTNGANSITIAATGAAGGGLTWSDVTSATQTITAGVGYLANRGLGVAFTLPASSTIGDVFVIAGVQGSWTLAQNANQQIKIGSSATSVGVGGSLASTNANDCIYAVASNTSASSVWIVFSSMGNITVV